MKYRTMDGLRPPGFEPGSKANSNPFRKPFPKRFLGSFYDTATLQTHNLFMVNFSYSITVPSKTEHIRAAASRNWPRGGRDSNSRSLSGTGFQCRLHH